MNTILGQDTTFTGTIEVKGGLRIDGVVKGKIVSSDEVTVGSTGQVEAEIQARSVVVAGRLVGDIVASEKIELQANSDVEGDLRSKSLVIEQGAIFCGGCHMKDNLPGKNRVKALEPRTQGEEKELAEALSGSADSGSSSFGLPFGSKDKS
ncbi:polymer-forming cytoskeletal protein [Gemmatimonas aurantiaca]|nr:polymer-forming cytoskeletal protein [Gemmatimonas aurantiaca]